jgi:protein-tyrosine phosphatase
MAGPDLVMRLAVAEDAPALYELREAAAAWQVAHGIIQWSPGEIALSAVVRQISRGEWWLSTSLDGSVDAGVRLLNRDPALWGETTDSGFIHGLVVARNATGRHLGSRVLSWAEDHLSRRGHRWARLDCVAGNGRLRRYYRDHGYSECGLLQFPAGSLWLPVMRFEKPLQPDQARG